MSVRISINYEGDLLTTAIHGPSGTELRTDAPVDNSGTGQAFSPTDLLGAAMGTCMLTIMGIYAKNHDLEIGGATARVDKEMSQDTPRRIAKLAAVIEVPLPADHAHKAALERAALGCPVHHSLHPDIEKPVEFRWTGRSSDFSPG